jgi:hypothetical protein
MVGPPGPQTHLRRIELKLNRYIRPSLFNINKQLEIPVTKKFLYSFLYLSREGSLW